MMHTEAWAAKQVIWRLTDRQTDGRMDRQKVAYLEMLWGDLGGKGGGAQTRGGHLVKHLSNEAAVLRILFFICLFVSLLLILTATFDNASVMCTCISMRSLTEIKLMLLQS